MFFCFKENVFLVRGALHSCIYDIPNNYLYQINKKACDLLNRVIAGESIIKDAEVNYLKNLCELDVLCKCEAPSISNAEIDNFIHCRRPLDFAWIEITNKCNLRCIHCYNDSDKSTKTTLSYHDFKHTVNELQEIGIRKVQLIGGEPFLIKKDILFAMMDYASQQMDSFEVFINGTKNTEKDLAEIKRRYHNIYIATSLHSYVMSEHEKVTQVKGSYKKTVNTIQQLRLLGVPYRFVGTKIGNICIGNDKGIGKPSRRDFIRLAGRANLKLYDEQLLKERLITKETIYSGQIGERIKKIYRENCYSTHLYIGSDMNVYPCPMEKRIIHGNLRDRHLSEIIKSQIINLSKADVKVCCDCEYRYLCRDCRPDSLTNKFSEKPWYCTYDPYTGEWESFEQVKKRLNIM